MEVRFQAYGDAVCSHIRYATRREKRDIRSELAAHMEDHACALLEEGLSPDEAAEAAVDCMGSPDEVGLALDQEYPLRWLVLARSTFLLLLAVGLVTLLLLPRAVDGVSGNLTARFCPDQCFEAYLPSLYSTCPLKIRQELPSGTTLSIQRSALCPGPSQGTCRAFVCVAVYARNPLATLSSTSCGLSFTRRDAPEEGPLLSFPWGETRQSALFYVYEIQDVRPGEVLLAHMQGYGRDYQWEVPLPEPEGTP